MPTGSSKPTKTGKTVLELQEKLPKARVVYCSATGEMLVLIMVVMMVVFWEFLMVKNVVMWCNMV